MNPKRALREEVALKHKKNAINIWSFVGYTRANNQTLGNLETGDGPTWEPGVGRRDTNNTVNSVVLDSSGAGPSWLEITERQPTVFETGSSDWANQ